MKRIKTALLSCIFAIGASAILLIGSGNDSSMQRKADGETTTVGYEYTVKVYKGKIAVFGFGESSPLEFLDCPLSSLPTAEAEKISAGINVADDAELQRLIEALD